MSDQAWCIPGFPRKHNNIKGVITILERNSSISSQEQKEAQKLQIEIVDESVMLVAQPVRRLPFGLKHEVERKLNDFFMKCGVGIRLANIATWASYLVLLAGDIMESPGPVKDPCAVF